LLIKNQPHNPPKPAKFTKSFPAASIISAGGFLAQIAVVKMHKILRLEKKKNVVLYKLLAGNAGDAKRPPTILTYMYFIQRGFLRANQRYVM
jgi:hypothetical protein